MKKIVSIVVVVAVCLALSITAFAGVDFTIPKEKVLHISHDEVRPGIMCGQDTAKINTPVLESGTTEAVFWGWVALAEDVESLSYSINNGEIISLNDAVIEAEKPVLDAAAGVAGATTASRFLVKVPVTEGTQLVKVFADFESGSEVFWIAEITVGEATEYDPNAGRVNKEDEANKDNVVTGDACVAFAVVAMGLVLTVVNKKKSIIW